MQSLIGELNALVVKIKEGTATLGEIEAFAAAAHQLNERAIILRYKAYEVQIHGEVVAAPSREERIQEPVSLPEENVWEVSEETTEAETPELDFDLFSLDETEPEQVETVLVEVQVVEKEIVLPIEENKEVANLEEIIVEESIETVTETRISLTDELVPEPVLTSFSTDIHPIYSKLATNDDSLAARLLQVRLETLKGAFGFNERMQIVQELFGGSSDTFNEAIEQLDQLDNKEQSRVLVSSFATQYSWKPESELALEFVQKVERRYA